MYLCQGFRKRSEYSYMHYHLDKKTFINGEAKKHTPIIYIKKVYLSSNQTSSNIKHIA